MNKLLRTAIAALVISSAVLAPWVVVALYNVSPRALEEGAWAMLQERTGHRILNLNRHGYVQKLGDNDAVRGELDVRELYIHIPDIGVASSHFIVVPSTGRIIQAWATTNVGFDTVAGGAQTLGGNTALTLYTSRVGGVGPFQGSAGAFTNDARVTNFAITLDTADRAGAIRTDDAIDEPVNMGDRIAVMTDGGATATAVGRITIIIRMQ